jgi:hypothetical protein
MHVPDRVTQQAARDATNLAKAEERRKAKAAAGQRNKRLKALPVFQPFVTDPGLSTQHPSPLGCPNADYADPSMKQAAPDPEAARRQAQREQEHHDKRTGEQTAKQTVEHPVTDVGGPSGKLAARPVKNPARRRAMRTLSARRYKAKKAEREQVAPLIDLNYSPEQPLTPLANQ